jgi:hypothetical protein
MLRVVAAHGFYKLPVVMYQLVLKTAPEAFHRGVVIAIPLARHGGLHAELFNQLSIVMSTVLAPAVRVMNQPVRRAFVAIVLQNQTLYASILWRCTQKDAASFLRHNWLRQS